MGEPVMLDKVVKCVEKTVGLKIKGVNADTKIKDSGVDSLYLFKFVGVIESEFEIEIEDIDLTSKNFETFGTVTELILKYKK
ncbi:phosphopantetheine-binding protein [Paenibacillus sp. Dod16]|uniref:phosphopantetheine-binding protein n=1 Tax=Paenibacillus sp. Dod16 TaxID=3416392 RepID=UPI003CF1B490